MATSRGQETTFTKSSKPTRSHKRTATAWQEKAHLIGPSRGPAGKAPAVEAPQSPPTLAMVEFEETEVLICRPAYKRQIVTKVLREVCHPWTEET